MCRLYASASSAESLGFEGLARCIGSSAEQNRGYARFNRNEAFMISGRI